MQLKLSFYDWCCLVPRPHFSSRRKCFGSRGPCENVYSARSPRIRHQNELTERDWENAVQGLGNDWCISILSSKKCQTPIILAGLLASLFVICDWWISIRFASFCVSRFVACDLIATKTRRYIPNIFDRFHPETSDFQISMR